MRFGITSCVVLACLSVNAAPFEYPVIGADYIQDATGRVFQVSNGYSERRAFVEGTIKNVVEPGDIVQDASGTSPIDYWYQMQDWLESNCDEYLNTNSLAIVGTTNALVNWTLETWLESSGMSSNGYRRATVYDPGAGDDWSVIEGGMWTNTGNGYGKIQAGDILGPWIIDDIMRGESTLVAAKYKAENYHAGLRMTGGNVSEAPYVGLTEARDRTAYTNAIAAWSISSTNTVPTTYYSIERYHETENFSPYQITWRGTRIWSTSVVSEADTPINTNLVYEWQCIYQPTKGGNPYETWWSPEESWTENQWELHASGTNATSIISVTNGIGSVGTGSPLEISPQLPYWTSGDGSIQTNEHAEVENVYFIVSPQFSHK